MTARFRRCLEIVLGHEGGVSNHPADRGGLTRAGITSATWERAQKLGVVPRDVALLAAPAELIERVYERLYWIASGASQLPAPFDLLLFDAWVNHRPTVAAGFLQAAVGVPVDGIVGPVTRRAAENAPRRAAVAGYFRARRAFYRRLVEQDPTQRVFARGWENRMRSLEREAEADLPAAPEAR